jgi:D-arabinose 1-dehydrogenase-like Zn-dependent alcohol dehydrogenase
LPKLNIWALNIWGRSDMSTCCSYDLVEWGKPFERRERALPDVPAKAVLVKITAAGLCHSDLHIKKGFMDLGAKGKLTFTQRGATLPLTLGHEIAGVIEAVGRDVNSVKVGQQVVVFPWIGCGNCLACAEDRESDCTSMRIIGIHRDGGFASHVVVEDEKFVIDIDGFDAAEIAPYACSGLTVFNGLEKLGPVRDNEWLAILGAGGLGLNAVAIARAMGYAHIVAVDIDDTKLDAAVEMGADARVNARADDADESLKDITQNRLFAVLDTFGSGDTGALAVSAITKAGRYVVVGQHGGDFTMPQIWLPQKALTVRGSHVGNASQLRTVIDMYKNGKLKPIPVEVRPLSEINEAIEALQAGQVTGRIVFNPQDGL